MDNNKDFNTSNVTIQPPEIFQNDIELYHFNTSNVTIQQPIVL